MRDSPPSSSNRHSSTRSAASLNRAKFVPLPSNVAPSGYADPGQQSITHTSSSDRWGWRNAAPTPAAAATYVTGARPSPSGRGECGGRRRVARAGAVEVDDDELFGDELGDADDRREGDI